MKNNNIFTIIISVVIVVAISLIIWSGNKNKAGAPADGLTDKPAPDFTLADRNGKIYSLSELRDKNIILFFNEGLMCYPSCWNQIVALAKDERFKDAGTIVLSVVVDNPQDWRGAVEKMPELAEAIIVFDKNAEVSKKFGMLTTASSMHYGSFPGHTYVIIDKEGVIKYVFDDPDMGIRNDQLIAEIEKLN